MLPDANFKKGKIIIISGPSGVGKTSVCKALSSTIPYLMRSVSATTRPKRVGEVKGKEFRDKLYKVADILNKRDNFVDESND